MKASFLLALLFTAGCSKSYDPQAYKIALARNTSKGIPNHPPGDEYRRTMQVLGTPYSLPDADKALLLCSEAIVTRAGKHGVRFDDDIEKQLAATVDGLQVSETEQTLANACAESSIRQGQATVDLAKAN
jgi:hypothetical protein